MIGGERAKLQVGAHQAVAQPGVHRARLSAADPRDAVRRPDPGVPRAGRRAAARDLRQHEDRGRQDRRRARRARSTPASRPWPATTCSSPSSATRPRAGRRARSRRTFRMRAAGCGSRLPSFPDLDALNDWLEQRCIEQWSEIAAWRPARHGRRRAGPRRSPA